MSLAFGKAAREAGIAVSMGSRGDAYDNAVAETFFATLKKELVNRRTWPNRLELQSAVFEYIEAFYNRQRRHSTLNMLSPSQLRTATTLSARQLRAMTRTRQNQQQQPTPGVTQTEGGPRRRRVGQSDSPASAPVASRWASSRRAGTSSPPTSATPTPLTPTCATSARRTPGSSSAPPTTRTAAPAATNGSSATTRTTTGCRSNAAQAGSPARRGSSSNGAINRHRCHRCGRQADALAVCQRARGPLWTKPGVEPSPSLREFERTILDQDPSVRADAAGAVKLAVHALTPRE